MKLTEHNRNSICRSIMNDVPQPEYYEEMRKALVEAALDEMPEQVRLMWLDEKTRPFVNITSVHCYGIGYIDNVPYPSDQTMDVNTLRPQVIDKLHELKKAKNEFEAMQKRVRANLSSCTTENSLRKRFPEFKKYIDMEFGAEGTSKNLPATNNLITDLMCLGWPK